MENNINWFIRYRISIEYISVDWCWRDELWFFQANDEWQIQCQLVGKFFLNFEVAYRLRGDGCAFCSLLRIVVYRTDCDRGNLPPIDPFKARCCPATGSQSGQHRQKKDIFLFIILHYPFCVGRVRGASSAVRATVDRRGDDEIWDTWLDLKRRQSLVESTSRRTYNAALERRASGKVC